MYSLRNVHLTLVLYVQSAQCSSNINPVCTVCTMYISHYSCMYSLHNVHITLVLYVQSAQCTSNISPACTVCTMYI